MRFRPAILIPIVASTACATDTLGSPLNPNLAFWGGDGIEVTSYAMAVVIGEPCQLARSDARLHVRADSSFQVIATVRGGSRAGDLRVLDGRVSATGDLVIRGHAMPLRRGQHGSFANYNCAP